MSIKFIPYDTKIDFVKYKTIFFAIFGLISLISLSFLLFRGVNYGIEFKGGYVLEVRSKTTPDIAKMRESLSDLNFGGVMLQKIGSGNDVLIRIRDLGLTSQKDRDATLNKIKQTLGDIEYRKVESVGPQIGGELVTDGLYAVGFALVLMLIYIWLRFEWQFAICGVLSLFHDALAVLGFYAIFHSFEFNTNALISLLTVVGYSINDAVVVFDRIRENIKKSGIADIKTIINNSLNETLSRTILTSVTTILALLVLYLFGGEVIASFSMPILVGILVGTFSSICLAAPMLMHIGVEGVMQDSSKDTNNFS